jgi:putative transposase
VTLHAKEKGLECCVHTTKHILQNLGMKARYIRSDGFDVAELACLGIVIELRLGHSVAVPTLLQRCVVQLSTHLERGLQSLPLLAIGIQPICEGLSGHGSYFSTGLWLMASEIRYGRHGVFQLHIHFFEKVCADFEAQLVGIDGEDNHVHACERSIQAFCFVAGEPPQRCVQPIAGDRPDLAQRYWKGVLWSPFYFAASCGGTPTAIPQTYIDQQRTPHEPALYPRPERPGFTARRDKGVRCELQQDPAAAVAIQFSMSFSGSASRHENPPVADP